MKKLILSALAASLTLSPLAMTAADAAPLQQRSVTTVRHNGHGRTVVTNRTVTRTPARHAWRRGERFDHRYATNYRELDYRHYRGLRQPPRGYHWVRSGNDAVLVGITSGIIASVLANAVR